uniref:NADH dehydrogenase, subunit 5 n=1 Tax=uncultured Thiotrichaceae bacterium TaxID=298394 RepID=A0A6S6UJ53_9GAMM|nr:MAG: NADH dehydrogenase, subunit 5 [uncultured Thiotrichaceae bacterium]
MDKLILLLPLLPILSALLTHFFSGYLGRGAVRIGLVNSVIILILAGFLLSLKLSGHEESLHALGGSWGSLIFDPLSLLISFVIAGINLIVRMYSVRYMVEETGYVRFFVQMDLMVAMLLLMVSAGDLITLLIAWHGVGVLLYFLLGQDISSESAHRYGFWTFITYRIGDLPLVLAAVLLFNAFGTWSLPDIFDRVAEAPMAHTVFGMPLIEVVATLIALAAFARSAQFLMHTWLPYTMEGPTPVSAMMHAGIVNAGGFLINRFADIYIHTSGVLHWVFIVGLVTALVGSALMLSQNDIKKSLGYSTMGQMGFMIMECGVGAFSLAVFHLIAHGVFKGTLFLNTGGVIGEARHHDGVPKKELYTFMIEKQPQRNRYSWGLMAFLTLVVPVSVLGVAHWAVEPDIFQQQGAVILLFFGWVTGVQLLSITYNMHSERPWRLVMLIIFSFTVVIIGYTLISHAFARFLYPEPGMIAQLYAAARLDLTGFDIVVVLITSILLFTWIGAYHADPTAAKGKSMRTRMWLSVYSLLSRELYIADLWTVLHRWLLSASARINNLLRWG